MGSVLPLDFRKKHHKEWYLAKTLCILLILVSVGLYYASDQFLGSFTGNSSSRIVGADDALGTLALNNHYHISGDEQHSFDTMEAIGALADVQGGDNGTFPFANLTSCAPKTIPYAYRCQFVRKHSACGANVYMRIQYCTFKKKLEPLYFILAILWLLLLFYLLGDTAEAYFSSSLIKISGYLRLSPNIAGVTLLALGNGAPDLSAIIVGVLSGDTDIGVGAPIGGGVFVTTVVLGAVILFADVKVTRRPFIRDVVFYLCSVLWVFIWFLTNKVYIWQSILCLVLYLLYVLTVVFGRMIYQRLKARRLKRQAVAELEKAEQKKSRRLMKKERKQQKQQTENADLSVGLLDNEIEPDIQSETSLVSLVINENENFGKEIDSDSDSDDDSESEEEHWAGGLWRRKPSFVQYDRQSSVDLKDETTTEVPEISETPDENSKPKLNPAKSFFYGPKMGIVQRGNDDEALVIKEYFDEEGDEKKNEELTEVNDDSDDEEKENKVKKFFVDLIDSTGWFDMPWYEKITFVLFGAILALLRNLTIPKSDDEEWNKYFATLIPIFAPVAILVAINKVHILIGKVFPLAVLLALIGAILGVLVFLSTRRSKPPIYHFLFVIFAFGMSIVWIYMVANQLLSLLEALGNAWGIDKSVLALTVLSWGNSIGDMISDIVIAKQGFPSMAVGACLGAPMLNLLLGLGVAMTFTPEQLSKRCFSMEADAPTAVAFLFLLVSLLSTLIVIPLSRFRGYKVYGVYLMLLYVCYLVLAVTTALNPKLTKAFSWKLGRGC